jgi:hypothetical protein
MKRCIIVILLYYLFLPTLLLAGSLEDARLFERIYLAAAIRVEAVPKKMIGTGFFTKFRKDPNKVMFTTNKHLVEGATELQLTVPIIDSTNSIIRTVTFNVPLVKDTVKQYYIPRDGIDLALMIISKESIKEVGQQESLKVTYFSSLPFSFYANIKNLFAGQPILFTGYPLSLNVNKTKPLLRKGCIAGIDTMRNIIYLDADAFGGSSGSPVFIDFSSQSNLEFYQSYHQMLVGIICGYEPFEKQLFDLQTGRIEMIQTENSGIARVVPAETIRKMADSLLVKLK